MRSDPARRTNYYGVIYICHLVSQACDYWAYGCADAWTLERLANNTNNRYSDARVVWELGNINLSGNPT